MVLTSDFSPKTCGKGWLQSAEWMFLWFQNKVPLRPHPCSRESIAMCCPLTLAIVSVKHNLETQLQFSSMNVSDCIFTIYRGNPNILNFSIYVNQPMRKLSKDKAWTSGRPNQIDLIERKFEEKIDTILGAACKSLPSSCSSQLHHLPSQLSDVLLIDLTTDLLVFEKSCLLTGMLLSTKMFQV